MTKYILLWGGLLALGYSLLLLVLNFIFCRSNFWRRRTAFRTLSTLWGNRVVVFELEELSKIWRTPTSDAEKKTTQIFRERRTTDFFNDHLQGRNYMKGAAGRVIIDILRILDKECFNAPSVVKTGAETSDRELFTKSQYDILARTTLADHSINVAEEILTLVKPGPGVVKYMLAALAHDLGKLPSYRDDGTYSMGDHPLISVMVLGRIDGFDRLACRRDVENAIKDHHRNPKERLSRVLKEADQAARRKEYAQNMDINDQSPNRPEAASRSRAETEAPKPYGTAPAKSTQGDPFGAKGGEQEKRFVRTDKIHIPWFDVDGLLQKLKPMVNRLDTRGRWEAFSMSNGMVYFQVNAVRKACLELASERGDESLILSKNDESEKHRLMLSVVDRLKANDAIPDNEIGKNYFSARYHIFLKGENKKTRKIYAPGYIPIKVEAFNVKVSEFESLKKGRLAEISSVEHIYGEKE